LEGVLTDLDFDGVVVVEFVPLLRFLGGSELALM